VLRERVQKYAFFLCYSESGLNRVRRQDTPVLPTSMNFDIPNLYKETIDGKQFLIADKIKRSNGIISQRIIVFASDDQLRLLFNCSHVMMDGTFKSCPKHFDQVYTVHGLVHDQSESLSLTFSQSNRSTPGFVCVIALLCGRSVTIYQELFSILNQHAHRLKLRFQPTRITSDFETALIKAVAEEVRSLIFFL
jgi:hypothetical protein